MRIRWQICNGLKFKNKRQIGQNERNAVIAADFIIVLLPAGKGSHVELGIGLGLSKKVYLYSSTDEVNNLHTTSTFYHLDEVNQFIGTIEEFIDYVSLDNK